MSNKAMDWATDLRGIKPGEKLVLLLLADCHNSHTGRCDPSQKRLSEESGFSVRAVQRHLESLENHAGFGLIKRRTEQLGRGHGSRTDYALNLSNLQATNWHVQDNAPDKIDSCTRHFDTLDTTGASSLLKEEPEIEPERTVKAQNPNFEKAWKLYNSSPLKARQTKKRAAQAWAVAVRKVGADRLMASIAKEVELAIAAKRRRAFHPNLPDMHRWLSQERWADLESAEQETTKPDAPTESQWRSAIEVWMANGRAGWVGGKFGPAPDQPDYFGPEIKPRAAA